MVKSKSNKKIGLPGQCLKSHFQHKDFSTWVVQWCTFSSRKLKRFIFSTCISRSKIKMEESSSLATQLWQWGNSFGSHEDMRPCHPFQPLIFRILWYCGCIPKDGTYRWPVRTGLAPMSLIVIQRLWPMVWRMGCEIVALSTKMADFNLFFWKVAWYQLWRNMVNCFWF